MKQQKRSEETRKRILDAAETLFARQGYSGTSIRQIVAEAGISIQTLHYHFVNKISLYHAILERSIGPLITMIDGHVKAMTDHDITNDEALTEFLDKIVDDLFDAFHNSPNHPLLFFRQWLEQDREMLLVEWEQVIPTLMRWADIGRNLNGIRQGPGVDLRLLLLNFTWIYTGLFVNTTFVSEVIGIKRTDKVYLPYLKQHTKMITRRMLGRNSH